MDAQAVTDAFTQAAAAYYQQKEDEFTAPVMREVERVVLLRVVDEYWMEHIDAMSDLRQASACGPMPRPTPSSPIRRNPWRCSRR